MAGQGPPLQSTFLSLEYDYCPAFVLCIPDYHIDHSPRAVIGWNRPYSQRYIVLFEKSEKLALIDYDYHVSIFGIQ